MRDLAAHHQVIAITHLPQIAGIAAHHYAVEKRQTGNKTTTIIKKLDWKEPSTKFETPQRRNCHRCEFENGKGVDGGMKGNKYYEMERMNEFETTEIVRKDCHSERSEESILIYCYGEIDSLVASLHQNDIVLLFQMYQIIKTPRLDASRICGIRR